MGGLIAMNLVLGLVMTGGGIPIDMAAHVGGLLAGLWLGYLLVPGRVATVASMWQRPDGGPAPDRRLALFRIAGVLGLVAVIAALVLVGPIASFA
jgi:uncharacterized BrkB/YihY/UPF0761 family membrane protein